VIFTLGVLWRRATAAAAVITVVTGFIFSGALFQFELLGRYNTFNHRALVCWIFCMVVMIVASLCTAPPPKEQIAGIIWNKSFLSLPPDEREMYGGLKDWRLWWLVLVGIVLSIYGFFVWYRIQHPW
jgi:Na+/proline symporter